MFYSRTLTQIAMRLAEKDLFAFRWSDKILREANDALVRDGRCSQARADSRRSAIYSMFPEGEVSDFEFLEPVLSCESKDRHVLAAAIVGRAEQIITFNKKDFPDEALAPHQIIAVSPDDFFLNVLDLYTSQVRSAVQELANDLKNPPVSVAQIITTISKAGCEQFAQGLQNIFAV